MQSASKGSRFSAQWHPIPRWPKSQCLRQRAWPKLNREPPARTLREASCLLDFLRQPKA